MFTLVRISLYSARDTWINKMIFTLAKYRLMAFFTKGEISKKYFQRYKELSLATGHRGFKRYLVERIRSENEDFSESTLKILSFPLICIQQSDDYLKFRLLGIQLFKCRLPSPVGSNKYLRWMVDNNYQRGTKFTPLTKHPFVREESDTKVIAYFLPQFYQMEVNDKWHGKGFTEWTNSSRAMPMFAGHEQPHIPYDVGYYDLLNPNTFKRQIELANMYGVYGFCFHWYWFSGERTMEKPLELLLQHPEWDIHYCFNWATENWTALWDGGNKELIFKQELKDGDDRKFFEDILPFLKDKRYIKIGGCPLISIYNIKIFSKERLLQFIRNLRKYAKEEGFPGIYFVATNTFWFNGDVSEYEIDALSEFPPSFVYNIEINHKWSPNNVNPRFCGKIFDYSSFVEHKLYLSTKYKSKNIYRSAMAGWDNTARKAYQNQCCVYYGANPQLFKSWLIDILRESKQIHNSENDICFINSWNEWAEGSHLEPCQRYGYGYLEAVKEALEEVRPLRYGVIEAQLANELVHSEVHFYVNCIESMGDVIACEPIARYLKSLRKNSLITWIVKKSYTEVLEANPYIDEIVTVSCLNEADLYCESKKGTVGAVIIDCHYNNRICSSTLKVHKNPINPMINEKSYFNYGSILETFSLCAGLNKINEAPIFYLKEGVLNPYNSMKYIVVHCKSAEKIKDWTSEKWNSLAKQMMDNGLKVVEIGAVKVINTNSDNYFDFTGLKDIQQIASIIKGSSLFISVDSGFAHIANCFNIPAVLLFGCYKTFKSYNPYTGSYKEDQKNLILIRGKNNGATETIEVKEVYDAIQSLIN